MRCPQRRCNSRGAASGGYAFCTLNPSRRAAIVSRVSRQTSSSVVGSWLAAIRAAASCKLSAARSGWARNRRCAVRRTASDGKISCHPSASWRVAASAASTSVAVIKFSRSRRASADAISTEVLHHATICGSSSRIANRPSRGGSSASNGMIAEASQNFIGPATIDPQSDHVPGLRVDAMCAPMECREVRARIARTKDAAAVGSRLQYRAVSGDRRLGRSIQFAPVARRARSGHKPRPRFPPAPSANMR